MGPGAVPRVDAAALILGRAASGVVVRVGDRGMGVELR
jgi:hypothetical protein